MKKIIVTTTINPPTQALLKYSLLKDWKLIVVGDLKTPHKDFIKLKNIIYLDPRSQDKISKKLSSVIGWNCIQRRNIGFFLAYKMGADIIASVDDDNIPLKNWGKNLLVNKHVNVRIFSEKNRFFDPLSVTEHKKIWHRGFPVQLLHKRDPNFIGKQKIFCLVQADLWNGDPDIDAICRIANNPEIKFKKFLPYSTNQLTPFNSQNTFISGKFIKYFPMLPFVGRMDDIWGAYYMQFKLNKKKPFIVYNNASVYQKRNKHNLINDLKNEIIGYDYTMKLNKKNFIGILPKDTKKFLKIWKTLF
jgi:hypothetical protein